jgi:hypothetical protein
MHAVRHLVSGGYMLVESDGQQYSRHAGNEILHLMNDKIFLKLMGMTKLVSKGKYGVLKFDADA